MDSLNFYAVSPCNLLWSDLVPFPGPPPPPPNPRPPTPPRWIPGGRVSFSLLGFGAFRCLGWVCLGGGGGRSVGGLGVGGGGLLGKGALPFGILPDLLVLIPVQKSRRGGKWVFGPGFWLSNFPFQGLERKKRDLKQTQKFSKRTQKDSSGRTGSKIGGHCGPSCACQSLSPVKVLMFFVVAMTFWRADGEVLRFWTSITCLVSNKPSGRHLYRFLLDRPTSI